MDRLVPFLMVFAVLGVLSGVPIAAVWFASRRFREATDRAAASGGLRCSRCGSNRVHPRPEEELSPNPGFECGKCGARLREAWSGRLYGSGLLLCLGLLAAGLAPLFADDGPEEAEIPIGFPVVVIGVGAYCARQLLRPAVLRD